MKPDLVLELCRGGGGGQEFLEKQAGGMGFREE